MDLADAYVAWKARAMTNPSSLSDTLPLDSGNISMPQPSSPLFRVQLLIPFLLTTLT